MKEKVAKCTVKQVEIVHRHHFSSKLQRMSVISKVTGSRSGFCSLVKGSPEAIGNLLAKGESPAWYEDAHMLMAEKGMRVLALAYKWVDGTDAGALAKQPRSWAESDLTFAGFIAFECKNRADSGVVVQALQESAHTVGMLTGDAPLTALHVAHTLGICNSKKVALKLTISEDGTKCGWEGAIGDDRGRKVDFACPGLVKLEETYDLITTEDALLQAAIITKDAIWKEVDTIHVFARMSPQGKATVIRMMQEHKEQHVLMCGDGGNDVGALKQADCGLALLGGYGNSNTEESKDDKDKEGKEGGEVQENKTNEEKLNAQLESSTKKQKEIQKLINAHMVKKRAEITAKQQQWVTEMVNGGEGWMAAIRKCTGRMQEEIKREQMAAHKKYGSTFAPKKDALTEALGEGDAMDSVLPVVRPGDASVAAPFTTRVPSVRSVVDLIRQGRCTLLSALQQQQIMMLQCTISAYTLSAISLEGARSSERQMMASSWLILTASLAFSYSTPIDKMSPVRPIKSLFHPAIFISMIGQAIIHLCCMVYAVQLATSTMGPKKLAEVVAFNKAVRAGESVTPESDGDEDPWAEFSMLWSKPFMPNLMNTVIFLVETAQIMAVLLVNYKGRPWMKGVMENHALCLSLFITIAALMVFAWGISPELNKLIHLEEFPDDEFRWQVAALVMISLFGTFIWDRIITCVKPAAAPMPPPAARAGQGPRCLALLSVALRWPRLALRVSPVADGALTCHPLLLCRTRLPFLSCPRRYFFAPVIFKAMWDEAKNTTFADILPVITTLAKVVGGVTVFASGNPLIWALTGWYFWKNRAK